VTRLIFVRHGESNVTVERIIGGPVSCTGLSPLGQKQAAALSKRWAETGEIKADVLIASEYPRAIETASYLAPALGSLPIVQVHDVGEHFPGPVCDGMTYEDYVDQFGGESWEANPYASGFPGGETLAAFQHRIATAIATIMAEHKDKTVVIVCHGGVIDRAVRLLMHTPPNGAFEISTVNTSITEFLNVRDNTWRLIRYNDAAHLAGLPKATPKVVVEKPNADLMELRPVDAGNVDAVSAIKPTLTPPWTSEPAPSVQRALLNAHLSPWTTLERAAYVDGKVVGFAVLATPEPRTDRPFDGWYLWRFGIEQTRQRRGYGRRLIQLVCATVRERQPNGAELFATWAPGSDTGTFLQQIGLEATGETYNDEVVGRLVTWPEETR
jgi:2,3-bisphosphoglycerate-dependent phosphoglycerate mutase